MHKDARFCWENISAVFLVGKQQFGFALSFCREGGGVWQKLGLRSQHHQHRHHRHSPIIKYHTYL